ncbi:MAG: hypothetical protein GXO87_14720, partial [Chlorobi bacterium]|nr:hypothetical protein [Chlorobiota bacterium]
KYAIERNREIEENTFEKRLSAQFDNFSPTKNQKETASLFKELNVRNYKYEKLRTVLKGVFDFHEKVTGALLYSAIETANNFYPAEFSSEIEKIILATDSESVFAAAAIYLSQNGSGLSREEILSLTKQKFEDFEKHLLIKLLDNELKMDSTKGNISKEMLKSLLRHPFQKGKTVIFSFQRENRNFPGITIVRKPDGNFATNKDGSIFSVPQLAASAVSFPGFMKDGETPEGIFSIVGWYITPTESIGPTPIVLTRSPFEVTPKIFYHGKQNLNKWNLQDYLALLPKGCKDYLPLREAFYAGKLGRRLIIMHGSTDNLKYFEKKPYYPLTPSLGCLTTKEIWNAKTGKAVESDQVKLINAFFSTKVLEGFLIVIEIDNKNKPVTIDEIISLLSDSN